MDDTAARRRNHHRQFVCWVGLLFCATISVWFGVWEAGKSEHLPGPMIFAQGFAPMFVSLLNSHLVTILPAGNKVVVRWFKIAAVAAAAGAVYLSTRAMTLVLWHSLHWAGPVFGGVLDITDMLCAGVLLYMLDPVAEAPGVPLPEVQIVPDSVPVFEPVGVPDPEPVSVPLSPLQGVPLAVPLSVPVDTSGGVPPGPPPPPPAEPSDPPPVDLEQDSDADPDDGSADDPETERPGSRQPRTAAGPVDMSREAQDARKVYRASKRAAAAGEITRPIGRRALGARYGQSPRWGQNRIDEVNAGPHSMTG